MKKKLWLFNEVDAVSERESKKKLKKHGLKSALKFYFEIVLVAIGWKRKLAFFEKREGSLQTGL